MDFKHVSVLLNETIDGLNINPDGIYVDGTLGGGGHSYEICKRLSDKGRLIGIDQDGEALEAARERLKEFEDKITLVRSNYCEIDTILKDLEIEKVDGIVFKESGVTRRLAETARGPLIDVITILLGITVGASTQATQFLTLNSIKIFGLGALSFVIATCAGVLFVKFFNLFLKEGNKINPLIGNSGVRDQRTFPNRHHPCPAHAAGARPAESH